MHITFTGTQIVTRLYADSPIIRNIDNWL